MYVSRYENRYNPPGKPVLQGLLENFYKILDNLKFHHNDVTTSRIIASIINDLLSNISRPLSVEETMALADSVTLFFYCCIVYDKGISDICNDFVTFSLFEILLLFFILFQTTVVN